MNAPTVDIDLDLIRRLTQRMKPKQAAERLAELPDFFPPPERRTITDGETTREVWWVCSRSEAGRRYVVDLTWKRACNCPHGTFSTDDSRCFHYWSAKIASFTRRLMLRLSDTEWDEFELSNFPCFVAERLEQRQAERRHERELEQIRDLAIVERQGTRVFRISS